MFLNVGCSALHIRLAGFCLHVSGNHENMHFKVLTVFVGFINITVHFLIMNFTLILADWWSLVGFLLQLLLSCVAYFSHLTSMFKRTRQLD